MNPSHLRKPDVALLAAVVAACAAWPRPASAHGGIGDGLVALLVALLFGWQPIVAFAMVQFIGERSFRSKLGWWGLICLAMFGTFFALLGIVMKLAVDGPWWSLSIPFIGGIVAGVAVMLIARSRGVS